MAYIWQDNNWPALHWDTAKLLPLLTAMIYQQGRLQGKRDGLGFEELRDEAHLHLLTDDVARSSEIEGEHLQQAEVRSPIARHLGMTQVKALVPSSHDMGGVLEMMTGATAGYNRPHTRRGLSNWHSSLFPDGKSSLSGLIREHGRHERGFRRQLAHLQRGVLPTTRTRGS